MILCYFEQVCNLYTVMIQMMTLKKMKPFWAPIALVLTIGDRVIQRGITLNFLEK